MATKEHSALTDTDGIHEPKGAGALVAGATDSGKVYQSDGSASGSWDYVAGTDIDSGAAVANRVLTSDGAGGSTWELSSSGNEGAMLSIGKSTNNTTATTVSVLDTYYPIAGTWVEEGSVGMTTTAASGKLVVTDAGSYLLRADISMISSRSTAVVCFSFMKNGTQLGPRIRRKIGTGSDVGAISLSAFVPSLVATDELQVCVTFLTGEGGVGGDTVTVENGVFYASLEVAA